MIYLRRFLRLLLRLLRPRKGFTLRTALFAAPVTVLLTESIPLMPRLTTLRAVLALLRTTPFVPLRSADTGFIKKLKMPSLDPALDLRVFAILLGNKISFDQRTKRK